MINKFRYKKPLQVQSGVGGEVKEFNTLPRTKSKVSEHVTKKDTVFSKTLDADAKWKLKVSSVLKLIELCEHRFACTKVFLLIVKRNLQLQCELYNCMSNNL